MMNVEAYKNVVLYRMNVADHRCETKEWVEIGLLDVSWWIMEDARYIGIDKSIGHQSYWQLWIIEFEVILGMEMWDWQIMYGEFEIVRKTLEQGVWGQLGKAQLIIL